MPSLVLLGIKTHVSGDDLRVFCVLAILLRLIQLVFIIPLCGLLTKVHLHAKQRETLCLDPQQYSQREMNILISYIAIAAFSAILQMINEVLIFRVSSVGTPVETWKRSRLQPLCAIKFGPHAMLRITAFGLGIISWHNVYDYCHCTNPQTIICPNYAPFLWTIRGLLVTIAIEVSATLWIYLYGAYRFLRSLDCMRKRKRTLLCRYRDIDDPDGTSTWKIICKLCCTLTSLMTCCLFGGREAVMSDFVDISIALRHLFDDAGHLDVTLSDIMNGLILVAREQFEKREEIKRRLLLVTTSENDDDDDNDDAAPAVVAPAAVDVDVDAPTTSNNNNNNNNSGRNRRTSMYLRMSRIGEDQQTCFEETNRETLDITVEEDRLAIVEGAHFMRMALAIYGHAMFLLGHKATGLCTLTASSLCCQSCRLLGSTTVQGDNLCRCHTTAFLQETNLDPGDLLYANFATGVEKRPYCVLVDREYSAIVIVVRGTFALEDAVTDISLKPVSLQETAARYGFDGQSEYAHSGMHASAVWVAEDLTRLGILDSLLKGEHCQYPTHRLYITGHSLGAGVAAILALILHSSFPDLKCLCFEPPGCVMTRKASQQDYILSYVCGSDIVPRLSVSSLESLRDDVLEMIARTQVPKYQVLMPNPLLRQHSGKLTHRRTSIPESLFDQQLKDFWAYQRERKQKQEEISIQLVAPGKRIVHLVSTSTRDDENGSDDRFLFSPLLSSSNSTRITAIWANCEDFLEIQLASSLLADHDPRKVTKALESLAADADAALRPSNFSQV